MLTKKLIGWNGNFTSTYEATDMAWNGDAYECYLCHRDFNSLRGLNQHLASPARKFSVCVANMFGALFYYSTQDGASENTDVS